MHRQLFNFYFVHFFVPTNNYAPFPRATPLCCALPLSTASAPAPFAGPPLGLAPGAPPLDVLVAPLGGAVPLCGVAAGAWVFPLPLGVVAASGEARS